MKRIPILFFLLISGFLHSQKLGNATLTSSYMYNTAGSISLSSSIGEATPVSELIIGTHKLTQGYFQYQLKNTSQIIDKNKTVILSVFPNPFNEQFYIDLGKSGYGTIELVLENTLGQKVYSTTLKRIEGSTELIPIQVYSLATGTYMLNINFLNNTVENNISVKLIKK